MAKHRRVVVFYNKDGSEESQARHRMIDICPRCSPSNYIGRHRREG